LKRQVIGEFGEKRYLWSRDGAGEDVDLGVLDQVG